MDGIINLNKPPGISSAEALYRVRAVTSVRRSGHAGTLDPAAEGVLVICLGRATKLVESIMNQPKVYRVTARLDVTSESLDRETEMVPVEVRRVPRPDEIDAACRRFEGRIQQVPPATSAVKVGGQPAYRMARRGVAPPLRPREVIVYWLHVVRYAWPVLEFEMACGRGTYVRSLVRDLGKTLGCGGCLTALERRAVGPFRVGDAIGLDALAAMSDVRQAVVPIETAREWLSVRPVPIPPRPQTQHEKG